MWKILIYSSLEFAELSKDTPLHQISKTGTQMEPTPIITVHLSLAEGKVVASASWDVV